MLGKQDSDTRLELHSASQIILNYLRRSVSIRLKSGVNRSNIDAILVSSMISSEIKTRRGEHLNCAEFPAIITKNPAIADC